VASIYSTQFITQHQGAGASFTVPEGHTAVIRSITITNRAATHQSCIVTLVGTPNLWIINDMVAPKVTTAQSISVTHDVRVVIKSGQQIAAVSDPGIDCTVSGYLFE
jgi:hypothetical protein